MLENSNEIILELNMPAIPGLSFRHFRGEADYASIAAIRNARSAAGFSEGYFQAEDLAIEFKYLSNCSPDPMCLLPSSTGKPSPMASAAGWKKSNAHRGCRKQTGGIASL